MMVGIEMSTSILRNDRGMFQFGIVLTHVVINSFSYLGVFEVNVSKKPLLF